ncbi:MAG TPA: cyanophycin synthetase, partial [Chthonomonadaceae bacterium]|nr:cyanophycin synthetase [Chthonomonadaceae bacterium]
LPVAEFSPALPGVHSIENVLAASAAALIMGTPSEAIAAAVRTFSGVPHRMEFVADIRGVRYINNSMCTNVAAAIASLEAMDRPTLIIAGGAEKGLDFAPLIPTLHRKARQVVLIGSAADTMEATFRQGGYAPIRRAETLEEAVRLAQEDATPGDAVLLSPACASFDMFRDFEARGAAFRRAVHALEEETP